MVQIPAGTVALRDDRRGIRWQVEIAPFLLGRFPVTAALHCAATGTKARSRHERHPARGNLSWLDAIHVCNRLSVRSGPNPAYRRDPHSEDVTCDLTSDGYRLPTAR